MRNFVTTLMICLVGLCTSCRTGDSPVAPPGTEPGLRSLGSAQSAKTKVTIYASDTLRVGYDSLYVGFADSASGSTLRVMNATVVPMMYMTSMSHSCPVEQPSSGLAVNGFFPSAAVFTMPSNSMEPWAVRVSFVDTLRNVSGMVEIPVTVVNSSMVNILTAPDSTRYFVTMVKMSSPKVGMNDCEYLVHRRANMMSFPCVTDMSLEMTPDMPSMGHGSPGNVNPAHTFWGHYEGKVNFTMSGDWRITLVLKKDGTPQGTAVFWVTV